MQLEEAIFNRRSVREYTAEAIDDATIKSLIAAAVQAPNDVNEQPWTFTVVRDRRVLEQLSRAAKLHMLATRSPQEIEVFRSELEDPQFEIFYHAPALIVISGRSAGPWITEDSALAAENLMLAHMLNNWGPAGSALRKPTSTLPRGRLLSAFRRLWIPVAPIIVGRPQHASGSISRKDPEYSLGGLSNRSSGRSRI